MIRPELSAAAWAVRDHARSTTRVGCAVEDETGRIFVGCNVGHRFRCHDIHAEVNALSSLVAAGSDRAVIVVLAAERERFTPCGSCLDWIFEVGGPECRVAWQATEGGDVAVVTAAELMPMYPR